MLVTESEALDRLSERVYDNTRDIKQKNRQRRHNFVDMYGVEFTRNGDNGSPATFYISVSPDLVYFERFEFKLIIQPFTSSAGSGTDNATVVVNTTSLEIDGTTLSNLEIEPNPHRHTTQPHTHNIIAGVTQTHTTADDFTVSVEGIDVTPYLMAQYGSWISGEGVYPSLDINEEYDLLEVASDMVAEGDKAKADRLLKPGYKKIEIKSASPFMVTLTLYCKYSHLNR